MNTANNSNNNSNNLTSKKMVLSNAALHFVFIYRTNFISFFILKNTQKKDKIYIYEYTSKKARKTQTHIYNCSRHKSNKHPWLFVFRIHVYHAQVQTKLLFFIESLILFFFYSFLHFFI